MVDYFEEARKQVALDVSGPAEAFNNSENTFVEYRRLPGQRAFKKDSYFFYAACFGKGALLAADACFLDFCRHFLSPKEGIQLFEHRIMTELDAELAKFGQHLNNIHELYLPQKEAFKNFKGSSNFKIELFEEADIKMLYSYPGFNNALQYNLDSARPDVLAAAVFERGKILGLAGASKDSDQFWQIGLDIIPEARERHLGTALVKALAYEIIQRGHIPYYGTWAANIASRRVAHNSGFIPAWVELYSLAL